MPSAHAAIQRLADERALLLQGVDPLERQVAQLHGSADALRHAERRAAQAAARELTLGARAGQKEDLLRAQEDQSALLAELRVIQANGSSAQTEDERAERQAIADGREQADRQRQTRHEAHRAEAAAIDHALASLPLGFDPQCLADAQARVSAAQRRLDDAERAQVDALAAVRARSATEAECLRIEARRAELGARIDRVQESLADWLLFARCMSHDGLIALAIEDAGPALSALANDLLLACYGARFTLAIRTQVETAKGEAREGFDIEVHDAESGAAKSVMLMSGGERVFIEACLTRAIALYIAQHTGRRYDTLFSDEADGPLDPEHKRMFMAMKREVLRLGGYDREFFVSQTPQLTAMADAVIDLDGMALTAEQGAQDAVAE